MKRDFRKFCRLTLIWGLVLSFSMAFIGVASGKTLRLAHQLPTSFKLHEGMVLFATEVEKNTNGKISIQIFPSAQLYKGAETTDAVISGSVDFGLNAVSYWSGLTPLVGVFDLPFALKSYDFMEKFSYGAGGKIIKDTLDKLGVMLLAYCDYGFVQIANNKRPLIMPSDFNGLKTRIYSTYTAETIKALGGAPVEMSASDSYMAMSRGVIDAIYTGQTSLAHRKYWEVSKYVTHCDIAFPEFILFCNGATFKKLDKDSQEAILKAARKAEDWLRTQCKIEDDKAMAVLGEHQMQIHKLSASERQVWMEKCSSVYEKFIKETGGPSGKGQELMNVLMK